MKPALLFLCHRVPYPPNKGDKIRSYHFLKHLSSKCRVFLGTFVDDEHDDQYIDRVSEMCEQLCVVRLRRPAALVKSTVALIGSGSLSVAHYRSAELSRWIQDVCSKENVDRVFAFSSQMAQYVSRSRPAHARVIVDFVDVDSDKWSQYASKKPPWMAWIYRLEAKRLRKFEQMTAISASASIVISDEEARLLRGSMDDASTNVATIPNGVDTEYFDPARDYPNPFGAFESPVVFTGAMDYWPNVDAVQWFVKDIWPRVRSRHAASRFYIVGSNPTAAVRELASRDVVVTGRVDDTRPYLAHAKAVIAPMRVARGVQNKVLEGMAMERPVICTPLAQLGIDARPTVHLEVATDEQEFAANVLRCLDDFVVRQAARRLVSEQYAWAAAYTSLDQLLEI